MVVELCEGGGEGGDGGVRMDSKTGICTVNAATVLDTAVFPRGELILERMGSAVKIVFPRDAVWVVLE